MTPDEFIFLSAAITVAVLVLAWSVSKPVKKAEAPAEPGRWRRFRIDPAAVHSGGPGTPVAEEPSGLRLARDAPPCDRRLTVSGGGARIDIAPPWLFPGTRLQVKVGGQAIATAARGKRREPAVTFRFPPGGPPYQVGGDPSGPEYEVRRAGKLVAAVFREPARAPGPRGAYFAEVLRSEDPLPVLALVLAAEACLGPRS